MCIRDRNQRRLRSSSVALSRILDEASLDYFYKLSLTNLKRIMWRGFPENWPIHEYSIAKTDITEGFERISAKVQEMKTPYTRAKVCMNWYLLIGDVNSESKRLTEILVTVKSLVQVDISIERTNLNDEGCATLAQFLQKSKLLTHFSLTAWWTRITDKGLSCLTSELPYLPLQQLHLLLGKTFITDKGITLLSVALNSICPLISKVEFSFYEFPSPSHVESIIMYAELESRTWVQVCWWNLYHVLLPSLIFISVYTSVVQFLMLA
eukprot:TRINITY_DN13631_c0_g1_i1.p1 TRINITY_DN13631_c0_g1~~TRINITY_DN13631_c0_g1_i1.p1  ORF type:complete len:266 (-),score=11.40 TRINITY_DN13631_c0_g1_i1:253-1050(-)